MSAPLTLSVVIPCYRQERFLPRTLAALDRALEGRAWRGALVLAAPDHAPLPALGPQWQALAPPVAQPLTPGAARMLGLSALDASWVLFVDADVELDAVWMREALAMAERADARLGGLWGRLEEWFVDGEGERPGNPDMYKVGRTERETPYMATLAFYRRDALVRAGGYDPRLSSEEDFELGLRLGAAGFTMRSAGRLAARHWSAPRPSFGELVRRWRSGLCFGQGQVLRLYWGSPRLATLLRRQALNLATLGMWLLGALTLAFALISGDTGPLVRWALLPLLVVAVMSVRKRSLKLGVHSLLAWSFNGAGLLVGLFRLPAGRRDPIATGGIS